MSKRKYRTGENVIYRMTKRSQRPGPRAKNVRSSPHGEQYSYCVDKYWTVVGQRDDVVLVATRRGKTRQLDADSRQLRRPNLWQRLIFHHRFPRLEGAEDPK